MNINGLLALLYMLILPVFIITIIWMVNGVGMTAMEGLGIGAILGQFVAVWILIAQFYFRKKEGS